VEIDMSLGGVLNLIVDGVPWLSNIQTPWTPVTGQFSFAARTGGSTDNHWVDDVCIRTLENFGTPSFAAQPTNRTVTEGTAVEWVSAANGSPCWSFQWYSNGVALAGADRARYTTPPVTVAGDNGAQYRVIVSNAYGAATSAVATLTVLADTNGPALLYAVATNDFSISVMFSEPMQETAGYAGYWTVTDTNLVAVPVDVATVSTANPRRVDLTLGGVGMLVGERYIVQASAIDNAWPTPDDGVVDGYANAVNPNPASATVLCLANYSGDVENLVSLPLDTRMAPGSLTTRGFALQIMQSAHPFPQDNVVAEQILAGVFPGQGTNVAGLSCTSEGGTINYNWELNNLGRLTPDSAIPGINVAPGFNHDYFVCEARAYVALEPGVYRWGVNSDEGFRLTPAVNTADPHAATALAAFNGPRTAADTVFDFVVTEPGLYPIRLVWEQGTGPASCELWEESLLDGLTRGLNADGAPATYVPPGGGTLEIVTCATNRTLAAGAGCQAAAPDLAAQTVAIAGCGAALMSQTPAAGTLLGLGSHAVTVVASNGAQVATCVATVTVVDVTAPALACPPAQVLALDTNLCQAILPDWTGIASDNCGAPTVLQSPLPGTGISVPGTNVTITAWDAASNMNVCVVSVTVVDPASNIWLVVRRGATNALLSWPVTCSGWTLEVATNLPGGQLNWLVSPLAPASTNGAWQVGLPASRRTDLYRLSR
jgi:hypothetical protein